MVMSERSVVRMAPSCALLALLLTAACGSDGKSGSGDDEPADAGPLEGAQCQPADVPCVDEQVAALMLHDTESGGTIREEAAPAGQFFTHIDATAGGLDGTGGYTYARFSPQGLVAVSLSDQEALASSEWDIAFRRYVIRLNSGVSGPSCVKGARTAPATQFAELRSVPAGLAFRAEQYFTADGCMLVPDTSGIGAPQTVLSSFWSYPGCVAMTGNVYVIALASGRHVKLQVASYYSPESQQACDEQGMATDPSTAANLRIRWAFVD